MAEHSEASARIAEGSRLRSWWRQRRWRKTFRSLRRRLWSWPCLGLLVLVATWLGYVGFREYGRAANESWGSLDILIRALQLFTLESGAVERPECVDWQLQVARFLAPALPVYAVIKTIADFSWDRLVRLWVFLFVRRHVVICGLGANGYLLATRCFKKGMSVIVIENDPTNRRISACHERGIVVMEDNARDPLVLEQAGVRNASYVVIVCGQDRVNLEIMLAVREVVGQRNGWLDRVPPFPDSGRKRTRRRLTCVLHVFDSHLCQMLAERELRSPIENFVDVHFFSVYERGARRLLASQPPSDSPHLLIVGMGSLGENLLQEAAKQWWHFRQPLDHKLPITVLDRGAVRKIKGLQTLHAPIDQACEITAIDMDFHSREFAEGEFLFGRPDGRDVTDLYVCLANDIESLNVGLTLRRALLSHGHAPVRLVIRTLDTTGIDEFLHEGRGLESLNLFGLFDEVAAPELLLEGVRERIALAFHKNFREQEEARREEARRKKAPEPPRKPTDKPWNELTDAQRESNRLRADQLDEHLTQIRCDYRHRMDWNAPYFQFTREEVEKLAELEHERWQEAKVKEGWKHAEQRNEEKKEHPDLVPWDTLAPESQNYCRQSCEGIPIFLAGVGLEVYRSPS